MIYDVFIFNRKVMFMKLGNFYGLTAPNIIVLREAFSEEDFIKTVDLLNNPVDKNFIGQTKQELAFFRKALDRIPVNYKSDMHLGILQEFPEAIISRGVLQGVPNAGIAIEQIKRYMAVRIACYVCQPNRRNTLDVCLFNGNIETAEIRKIFNKVITDYLKDNSLKLSDVDVAVNRIARKLLDRKGDTVFTPEKEKLFYGVVQAFSLNEELVTSFQLGDEELILNDAEIKIISWFKQRREIINSCFPFMTEKIITSNQQVFSMPFRDLIFRRPERLISEVTHFYKSANVSTGREKIIKNIKTNVLEQVKLFEDLFAENVLQQGVLEEKKEFAISVSEGDSESLAILKNALRNYDLRIANCDEDKLNVLSKIFEFTRGLTKDFYNTLFGVELSLEEWEQTIAKLNKLGIAGINFHSTHLFIRSLNAFSFDDKVKIEKSFSEIETYKRILEEVHAFLDSQLPIGTEIGGAK